MAINGEYPDVFSCTNCGKTENLAGYSPERNGALCSACLPAVHGWRLKETTIYTMQVIIANPLEKLYQFNVSDEIFTELNYVVEKFRIRMIEKRFKTLEILESLQI